MLKIVGLSSDRGACSSYRLIQPLEKLNHLQLAQAKVMNGLEPDVGDNVDASDIVCFGRAASGKILGMIDKLHSMGKKVVFDLDDNLFNISPFSQHYQNLGIIPYNLETDDGESVMMWKDGINGFDIRNNRNFLKFFVQVLRIADGVTVTTEPLRNLYSNFNKNTIIVPNSTDMKIWKTKKIPRNDGKVKILYTGAANHYEDIMFMMPVLEQIQKDFNNVIFSFVGNDWKTVKNKLDYNRIEVSPWVSFEAYPYLLKSLNCDIGLAPVAESFFSDCRSAIKWYEYSALGIPTIATNFGPYKREMNNQNAFLVGNVEKEWYQGLSALIKYPGVRQSAAENGYKEVVDNHNLDYVAEDWIETFKEI